MSANEHVFLSALLSACHISCIRVDLTLYSLLVLHLLSLIRYPLFLLLFLRLQLSSSQSVDFSLTPHNESRENSNKQVNMHQMVGGQPNDHNRNGSNERNLQTEIGLTMSPTSYPSIHPSVYPTTFPSTYPTIHASSLPSTMPSTYPTIIPSTYPSVMPSTYPTMIPSNHPSVLPSTYPTTIPSTYPSTLPSAYPTTLPSSYPSSHPTRMFQFPSMQPSVGPSQSSMQPSLQPSIHVSVQPLFSDGAVVVSGAEDGGGDPSAQQQSASLSSSSPPVSAFPEFSLDNTTNSTTDKGGGNGALIGVIACVLAFTFLIAVVGVYRIKSRRRRKKKEVVGMMMNDSILRGGRLPIKYRDNDDDPIIMVEVRNSTTGGWHGFYGEDQLQSIDFGTSRNDEDHDHVGQQSLLYDGGLEEIESTQYAIGELDHLSDEDLVKAYHDAMAVDVESEDEIDFAMQGVGSPSSDKDRHEIT